MYYDTINRLHNIAYEDIYNSKSQYVPVLRGKRNPQFSVEKRRTSNQLPWNIIMLRGKKFEEKDRKLLLPWEMSLNSPMLRG